MCNGRDKPLIGQIKDVRACVCVMSVCVMSVCVMSDVTLRSANQSSIIGQSSAKGGGIRISVLHTDFGSRVPIQTRELIPG